MGKRILQVSGLYAKVGGAEVYMHRLVEALRERGHTVALFGGNDEVELDEPEARVVRRPDFDAATLIRDEALAGAFREFGARFRPDLVHLHNISAFPADFPVHVAELGVPMVQTVHEWGLLCPNAWCVLPDGRRCEGGPGEKCLRNGCESNYPFDGRNLTSAILRFELVRRTFDRFLCPSQALADDLAHHGTPGLVSLPYWAERGDEDVAVEPGERDAGRILFLGRLVREKGVDVLLRAMPKVLEARPEARLSIVGGGSDEERLRALAAELALGERVVFHGRVPHEEVQDHLRRAWVNVLPSIWCENSPVTCYESYLSGLPMVASDIAGLPAMVVEGETGLLFRPRDADHLAERLVELLADERLHARLARGCRAALDRFDREDHLDRVEAIYAELLAERDGAERATSSASAPSLSSPDAIALLDRTVQEYTRIERWALDMKQHIDWLESQGPPSTWSRLLRKLKA